MKKLLSRLGLRPAPRARASIDNRFRDEGDVARDTGGWEAAAAAYERHLQINPADFAIWVQHGHMVKELGRLEDADVSYARAATLVPDDADLLLQRGHLAKRRGDLASAAEFYRTSFRLDGNPVAARELVDPAMLAALSGEIPSAAVSGARLVGSVDGVTAGVLVGWAVDPDAPDTAAEVEVLIDGRPVIREHVTLVREDVNRSGIASGPTGFRIRLVEVVPANEAYEVTVRLARTGDPLVNSPIVIAPSKDAKLWITRHSDMQAEDLARTKARMDAETAGQTLSIVMPVYNPPEAWLREALDSVLAQWCSRWELVCVNDASPEPHVKDVLAEYAARDKRIRVVNARRNGGIAKTTNLGIAKTKGDYIAFLDHDDFLEPEAVFRMLDAARTGAELIYSDEIITGESIDHIEHFVARSAFSHDYYLSHPYFVHLVAVRRDVALACEGYDETMSISADVDFILRVIERCERVAHVPAMLYRWRTHQTSAGHSSMARVTEATTSAHNRHLERMGSPGRSRPGLGFNIYRTDYPDDPARTLIVIPTKDGVNVLKPCIDALLKTTSRDDCDILIVDHQSKQAKTRNYFARIADKVNIIPYSGAFNFSAINNFAVREAGEGYKYIVFMNNDVEAIRPGWLERMRSLAARPEVGVVGATLLYGNRLVQHSGVVLGIGGAADHAHKFAALEAGQERRVGYNCSLVSTREYSAVTAACMMVRTEVFTGVGGYDEDLAVGYNDTDICLRIGSLGYRIINDAEEPLYHHESMTRALTDQVDHPHDGKAFVRRWAQLLAAGDPFYSPLLSSQTDHAIAHLDNVYAPVRVRAVRAPLRPLAAGRFGKTPAPILFPPSAEAS